jgi:hypothetical protein
MTTIINFITTNFTSSSPYSAISNGMAVISVALLLTILIEKVLLDAYEDRSIEYKTPAFLIIILPFLFVLVIVVFLRMAQILHL